MVYELKEFTQERFDNLLEEIKRRKKGKKMTLAGQGIEEEDYPKSACNEWKKEVLSKHYGSLIRGIDGVEYQKAVRSEWD